MVAQANGIARQFAQHYYQTFDTNPPALAALYVSPIPSLFIRCTMTHAAFHAARLAFVLA